MWSWRDLNSGSQARSTNLQYTKLYTVFVVSIPVPDWPKFQTLPFQMKRRWKFFLRYISRQLPQDHFSDLMLSHAVVTGCTERRCTTGTYSFQAI